jgi:hypothetical protein
MANEKISQMPLISTFASGDLFPIVDISEASAADRNKSVTFGELFRNVLGGSASDPSIAFTGDQNTGIYSPGADQVAVATNGTGRLFVDASGNVGLKVAAPSFVAGYTGLQADGGGNGSVIKLTNSTTGSTSADGFDLILQQGGSDAYVWQRESAPLIFGTAATERLRITSAGLVGIGTSAPGALLSVETNSATSAIGFAGRFYDTATNRGFGAPLLYVRTPNDTASASSIGMFGVGDNADTSELGNLFRITQTGQVGIGTASPSRLLHLSSASDVYIQVDRGSITSLFGTDNIGTYVGQQGAYDLRLVTNASERARIDSSGRLLVGTSTARSNIQISTGFGSVTPNHQFETSAATYAGLSLINNSTGYPAVFSLGKSRSAGGIGSNGIVANGDIVGMINFYGNDDSKFVRAATITAVIDGTPGADDMPGRLVFSTTADGASSSTERMRVTNSGLVRIGMSDFDAAPSATNAGLQLFNTTAGAIISASSGTASSAHALFFNPNGIVGRIDTSGSSTTYATSSDYRLKENITPVSDGITRLQQLKPSRFNFITDPATVVDGFIAHEAQEVVPECVTGTKDAVDADGNPVYQGIDQSKLVPLLTAALQEAIGEIESLKARVAALESA